MIHAFLALLLVQDPIPPPQQSPPAPPVAPEKPQTPPRSREDRLEGRIASDPAAKPAADAPPTEPAPKKPIDDPLAGWLRLNAVALIVNDTAVTMLDLRRDVNRNIRERKGGDPEALLGEAINNRAKLLLEIQGGKDLGFAPEAIERFVRDTMQKDTESAGSVTKLAARLKQEDVNSFERREEVNDYVNRVLWEQSVNGEAASPGGRLSRDKFVRPGFAMLVQRKAARRQDENRTVQVTQLVLVFEAPGDQDRLKKRIEDLRLRIENGEDMGALAEQFGKAAKGTHGLSEFMNINGLRNNYPELGAFLDKAEVGDLSPVFDYVEGGKLAGYVVVRPEEFKSVKVDPFDDPKTQRTWIEGQSERIAQWRKDSGLMELLSAAYVWPPQNFQAPEQKP